MPRRSGPGQTRRRRRAGRALLLALSLGLLLTAPASAAPGTRTRAALAAVQKHLGVFLTTGELRDPSERVVVQQRAVEVWFMRPVPPNERDAATCEGARWLLTGRLDASAGARALFAERSDLDRVSLIFFDLKTAVTRNRAGRYDQKRTPTPEIRFTITRERAAQLDPQSLAQTLSGARCGSLAASLLDELWVRE